MDNVSFHKSQIIKNTSKDKNYNLLFIPPYTPECNPIENVFSVVKNSYRKRNTNLSLNHIENIKLSFDELDKSSFQRCFNRMYDFINS
jgi:transposase